MTVSTVLAGAARAEDADTAAIFADVLNTDLAAIERMAGRRRFEPDDAMRIARILAEYERLTRGTGWADRAVTLAEEDLQLPPKGRPPGKA